MRGYILELGRNKKNNKPYGLISVDGDKNIYRFGKSDVRNCTISQLQEGDAVEFQTYLTNNGRLAAQLVDKVDQVSEENNKVNPGINPSVRFDHLNEREKAILLNLAKFLYVTSGGEEFRLNKSTFKYSLVKPTEFYRRTFHFSREIVVVFSDYVNFEPRSFDAASYVYSRMPEKLRIERGCFILVCHDNRVEEKLVYVLRDTNLNLIVIPFTYEELLSDNIDAQFLENRFKKYLFDVDLFAVSDPIEEDIFFFGRRDFVNDIVAKCKNGTNSGVFGLRRSGKTSLLYAVKRLLTQQSYPSVFIPCQSDLMEFPWNKALYKVVDDLYKSLINFDKSIEINRAEIDEAKYSSADNAIIYFERDMDKALSQIRYPVTFIFDEIEHITFGIKQDDENSSNHWFNGDGFCAFWNTLKGYYSKHPNKISILVAGTNPMINEVPYIGEKKLPNPMFRQLSESNQGAYLKPFTVEDTKNMVNTLGGYMGVSFDDYSIGRITDDCGGHPYLIRILCSYINKYIRLERPLTITKSIYDKALPEFEKSGEAESFYWMILNILNTNYEKEFNTLKILALEGDKVISQTQDKNALSHLLGYGLIENNHENYAIRFGTIARFLRGEYKFERQGMTIAEQREEINVRTNTAEIQLRKIVRNILQAVMGPTKAKEIVLQAMRDNKSVSDYKDVPKAEAMPFAKLFDTSKNNLPLTCLISIVLDNYTMFQNVFDGCAEQDVRTKLSIINNSRRCPSHAYDDDAEGWSWDIFVAFREAISWLENILKNYE